MSAACPHIGPGHLVVGKSTVPVGTAARLARASSRRRVQASPGTPSFCGRAFAVSDTPSRLTASCTASAIATNRAPEVLDGIYKRPLRGGVPPASSPTKRRAELVKVSATAFLATKISFIIRDWRRSRKSRAPMLTTLADVIGYDARIGRRLLIAGVGFWRRVPAEGHPRVPGAGARDSVSGMSAGLPRRRRRGQPRRRQARRRPRHRRTSAATRRARRVAVLGLALQGPNLTTCAISRSRCGAAPARGGCDRAGDRPGTDRDGASVRAPELDLLSRALRRRSPGADAVVVVTEWHSFAT